MSGPAMQETWGRSLGQKDPLEEEMATQLPTPLFQYQQTLPETKIGLN